MKKNIAKIFLLIILILPFNVLAEDLYEISYDEAQLKFDIDYDVWNEENLSEERNNIQDKWTNTCGTIMSGIIDIYDELDKEDLEGLERKDFNYINLFDSEEFAESFLEGYSKSINVDYWEYKDYNVKFIKVVGSTNYKGIDVNTVLYATINNGYALIIQYGKTGVQNGENCSYNIDDIAKSTVSMTKNYVDNSLNPLSIIIGIFITLISYMIYPFIRVKIMKKEYDINSCKRMALWNSIIVAIIFSILTAIIDGSAASWSPAPAILYYYINRNLWVKKQKKQNKPNDKDSKLNKKEEIIVYTCDKCGAKVNKDDLFCPKCGDKFDADEDEILELDDIMTIDENLYIEAVDSYNRFDYINAKLSK